jgi:hypothetical protein
MVDGMVVAEAAAAGLWQRAGWILLVLGVLWLVTGVLGGTLLVVSTPVPEYDPNDMGAGQAIGMVAPFFLAAIVTAPSLLFIVLGGVLVKRPRTAPVALVICVLASIQGAGTLAPLLVLPLNAGQGGFHRAFIFAEATALSLVVAATASLLSGYAARLRLTPRLSGVAPWHAWLLSVAVPALVILVVGVQARAALRMSPNDRGPLVDRSTRTLVQQARLDGGPEQDELMRRGADAAHAIVAILRECPLDPSRTQGIPRVGDMCTEGAIGNLQLELAALGGPESIDELRRWLRAPDAATVVRDHAAVALGRAGDIASVRDIASLLDVTTPVGFQPRRLDEVMTALETLHAKDEVPHIVATLRRIGPSGQGANRGMQAMCDLDTSDGWDAYRGFATSPDPKWRELALGLFTLQGPVPPQLTSLFLNALDDPDRGAASYACGALLGPGACARYPQLCARTHGQPCAKQLDVPDQTDLIRAAVQGRPLPSPASTSSTITPAQICGGCSAPTRPACSACVAQCTDKAQQNAFCVHYPGPACQRALEMCERACLYQGRCPGGMPVRSPL